jgi:hypothetical protein
MVTLCVNTGPLGQDVSTTGASWWRLSRGRQPIVNLLLKGINVKPN